MSGRDASMTSPFAKKERKPFHFPWQHVWEPAEIYTQTKRLGLFVEGKRCVCGREKPAEWTQEYRDQVYEERLRWMEENYPDRPYG